MWKPKRWFWKITKSSNSFHLLNKKKTFQNSPKQGVHANNHSFICSLLKFVSLGVLQVLYYRSPYTGLSNTLLIKISTEISCTYKQEGLNLISCVFSNTFQKIYRLCLVNKLDILVSPGVLRIYGTFSYCNCIPANMEVSLPSSMPVIISLYLPNTWSSGEVKPWNIVTWKKLVPTKRHREQPAVWK